MAGRWLGGGCGGASRCELTGAPPPPRPTTLCYPTRSNIQYIQSPQQGALQLTARVVSTVDGLDVDLFYKSLTLRRLFLAEKEAVAGGAGEW